MDKRTFIKKLGLGSLASTPLFKNLDKLVDHYSNVSPEELAKNEEFWKGIRSGYRLEARLHQFGEWILLYYSSRNPGEPNSSLP